MSNKTRKNNELILSCKLCTFLYAGYGGLTEVRSIIKLQFRLYSKTPLEHLYLSHYSNYLPYFMNFRRIGHRKFKLLTRIFLPCMVSYHPSTLGQRATSSAHSYWNLRIVGRQPMIYSAPATMPYHIAVYLRKGSTFVSSRWTLTRKLCLFAMKSLVAKSTHGSSSRPLRRRSRTSG